MQTLLTTTQIRAVEAAAFARVDSFSLMRKAGLAVARRARAALAGGKKPRALALIGPGNNGGDALVAGEELRRRGIDARAVFLGDAAKLSADARRARADWSGPAVTDSLPPESEMREFDLVIDGLFGVGLRRAPSGVFADAIRRVNAAQIPALAIDAPSGLDCDTGRALGEAIAARQTVTFFAAKPGFFTADGTDLAGEIVVETLACEEWIPRANVGFLFDSESIARAPFADSARRLLRRTKSHKGDFGALVAIGGADGMTGALALATRAAVFLGAGKVFAGALAARAPAFDGGAPDVMWRDARDKRALAVADVFAVGMGMGARAKSVLAAVVKTRKPALFDADALNLVAASPALQDALGKRRAATILTPHPGEAARLLQTTRAQIESDRIGAAQELARRFRAIVILKGAGSVVARADGAWHINSPNTAALARAGSGDILSGIIGALLAQKADAYAAAALGAHLHAAAAAQLAREAGGALGIDIGQIAPVAGRILNEHLRRLRARGNDE